MEATAQGSGTAVLGSIGRKRISFALPDAAGGIDRASVRHYDAASATGITDALTGFQRDLSLPTLPARSAFAVAGLARGDAISITRTRWFLSRSGLAAMLGRTPLILNDFAAEAWGFYGADPRPREVFGGDAADFSLQRPGCYAVMGITSGLGVAIVARDAAGGVSVLATEAGHGALVAGSDAVARAAADLCPGRHPVPAEELVSAPGLLALYGLFARRAGVAARAQTPEDVTRTMTTDPAAREACDLLARAFWAQAGNLVLTCGAWDGVVLTGKVADALRGVLRRPETQACFTGSGTGKHARMLARVPRVLVQQDHGDLAGLAEALRHHRD